MAIGSQVFGTSGKTGDELKQLISGALAQGGSSESNLTTALRSYGLSDEQIAYALGKSSDTTSATGGLLSSASRPEIEAGVKSWYATILKRTPRADEVKWWADEVEKSGKPLDAMKPAFISEAKELIDGKVSEDGNFVYSNGAWNPKSATGGTGITAGNGAAAGSATDPDAYAKSLVAGWFKSTLNSDPDPAALAHYVERFKSVGTTSAFAEFSAAAKTDPRFVKTSTANTEDGREYTEDELKNIRWFYEQYKNDPDKMTEGMLKFGVTLDGLHEATGVPLEDLRQKLSTTREVTAITGSNNAGGGFQSLTTTNKPLTDSKGVAVTRNASSAADATSSPGVKKWYNSQTKETTYAESAPGANWVEYNRQDKETVSELRRLYKEVLGREPDTEGINHYASTFGDSMDANEEASFRASARSELLTKPAKAKPVVKGVKTNRYGYMLPDGTDDNDFIGSPEWIAATKPAVPNGLLGAAPAPSMTPNRSTTPVAQASKPADTSINYGSERQMRRSDGLLNTVPQGF